jgi:hypothetical protein
MEDETLELNHKTTTEQKKSNTETNQASSSAAEPPPYKPNPAESAALEKYRSRRSEHTAPRLKIVVTGAQPLVKNDHPDPAVGAALFEQALGTANHDFTSGLMAQLSRLAYSADGKASEELLNFLFSVVKSVQPRDETEAILAAQMAGVHLAIMKALDQFGQAVSWPQQEMAERMLNRLVRTFVSLVAALKRYRSGPSK